MSTSTSSALEPIPSGRAAQNVAFSVRLKAARFTYAANVLFERLDFELQGGMLTCLLGPSGVGKSTLLRMLAGLTPDCTAHDIQCSDGKPLGGRVAYMDQRDLLLPWLSVLENVTLGARLRGEPRDRERAQSLLLRVGLAGQENEPPASLSGGMRQRVALARTLMEDRPVVLMDEPFSALDALTRFKLQNLAAELLRGRTVLLVTHDPIEALRLGERIHVMSGQPAEIDEALCPWGTTPRDPATLHRQPLHAELMRRLGLDRAHDR